VSHPAVGDVDIDRSPDSPTSIANSATQFVMHELCTEGYAIVAAETAEEIDRSTAPYVNMSGCTTWREFRSAELPIEVVREVVESQIGDLGYLVAIEQANDVTRNGDEIADRWAAVRELVFAGDHGYLADDDEFTWEWGYGDPDLEVDMLHQDAMLTDLPWEIIERFDLAQSTTLDGYLGRVDSDDLDQVVAALEALGHSVE
jgi:hypothetical protein